MEIQPSSDLFLSDTASFFAYIYMPFIYKKIAYVGQNWKFVLNMLSLFFSLYVLKIREEWKEALGIYNSLELKYTFSLLFTYLHFH